MYLKGHVGTDKTKYLSSTNCTGVQLANYLGQLAHFHFKGGDRHNEQPHQKSGQLNKNLIFGDFLNSLA